MLLLFKSFKVLFFIKGEKEFFEKKHGFKVKFLGHPLLDSIKNFKDSQNKDFSGENNKEIISILRENIFTKH